MKYFKLKFLLLFFALAAALPPAWAEETLTVCDQGTSISYYLPIYGQGYYTQANQMIYPASMLENMDGKTITKLTFYHSKALASTGTINVAMGNTTQATFASATAITGLTTVATDKPYTAGETEIVIEFDEGFQYTGDNLVIEVSIGTKGGYNSSSFVGVTQSSNTSYYAYSWSSSSAPSGYVQQFLPKATFNYEGELKPYAAKVSPANINFGKAIPGGTVSKNIVVKNNGANTITPSISGLTAPFGTTYTPAPLATGETATIPVLFAPSATGEYAATAQVSFDTNEIEAVNIELTGNCVNELTICDGETATNEKIPFYGYYNDVNGTTSQVIYPASKLALLDGKTITGVTFYTNNSGVQFYGGNTTVTMGFIDNTEFTSEDLFTIDGTTAVTTNYTPVAGGTEISLTFNPGLEYTAGKNLIIQTAVNATGSAVTTTFVGETTDYACAYNNKTYYGALMSFLPKATFAYSTPAIPGPTEVDAPVFDPEDGETFEENLTVSLSCATAGATIKYSYNNEYFTDYTEPIVIDETTTIYAKAVLGTVESEVVSATYTKEAAPQPSEGCPAVIAFKDADSDNSNAIGDDLTKFQATVSDGAGYVESIESQNVYQGQYGLKFSSGSKNGSLAIVLKDQTDGSTWEAYKVVVNAKKFKSDEEAKINVNLLGEVSLTDEFADYEFTIPQGRVLNAIQLIATKRLYVKSIIIYHKCGSELVQVTTPTFNPAEGEYTEAQNVTIACSTPGATIHYTVDGTDPTAESPVYSEPIAVGETMTIKAIAVKEGMTNSAIASATYTINIPEPGEDKIYVKLTTPELTPGKKYIFVYEGEQAMAMGAFNSNNTKCNPVNVTINNNEVNIAGKDDIIEFTAGEGPAVYGSDIKQYTLALPNGQYLAYKSSTDFKLLTNADTEAYWRIKTHDTGYTVYNASASGRSIQKNTSTNMFGPYADGQDAVAIYVEKSDEPVEPEQVATPTFDPEAGTYTEAQTVTIACETEGATIHYTVDGTEPTAESPVFTEAIAVGETTTIKAIAMKEGMTDSEMAEATYTINIPEPVVIGTPTFSPEAGSYTEAQTVTIACPTEGAVISYSTDGGETWTQGNTVTVNEDMTLMVKAEMEGGTTANATAVYAFEFPVEPINIEPFDGYYMIKNLGNEKYANVAGRKTLRFTDAPADKAGTVIRLKTDEHGKVISLRSQAADLQGYADKAMNYVPELVHLVAQKLETEGVGELFGETGVDAILAKFNESFDNHLYVEPAEGGYRLYGKTPSMQPVVEFYRENQAKCDAKLPMLETAINNAIQKILEKTNGSGAAILTPFSLHTIWEKMNDANLIEPVEGNDEAILAFYHQVLNNKNYVWSFAYETAMIYWTNLKNHPRYQTEIKPQLGEYADYLEKIEQVRPNFKYYIVQKDDKPDFISEGNVDIKGNAPRTIWSVEPRTDFTVNIPEENKVNNEYVTTLYTDFAYTLPEGVKAYKVTGITTDGIAITEAIEGTIPAQTPVLIKATEAGDKALTISNETVAAVEGNLLKGPDYLIGQYQIKAPTVVKLFTLVKGLFGEEIYNRYMLQYEHLMLRYAGTVNNKYFWGLSDEDVEKCVYINEDGDEDCVVRSLDVVDGEVAFHDNWTVNTNKAFLVSTEHAKITLGLRGDVNRDGVISISDVTALIDILLVGDLENKPLDAPSEMYPRGLDYEAADFNVSGEISIKDVTEMIDYLLANGMNN